MGTPRYVNVDNSEAPMTSHERIRLEQDARKLRSIADDIFRFAPLQALRLQGVAKELELRIADSVFADLSGVR